MIFREKMAIRIGLICLSITSFNVHADDSTQATTGDETTESAPETGDVEREDTESVEDDDGAIETGASSIEAVEPVLISPAELEAAAVRAPELDESQYGWLRPRRHLMDQVPRAQVDYTAYTLEWGELKVGLARIVFGVLPRMQVGTSPPLWALGIENANGKLNILRVGRFDFSLEGDWLNLPMGDEFAVGYLGWGARASLQVSDPMSIHFGGTSARIQGKGSPDLSSLPSLLISDEAKAEWNQSIDDAGATAEINANAVTVNLAVDWRFNRRDSLILQTGAWLNVDAAVAAHVPPVAGLHDAINESREYGLGDAYMASLAYQIAGEHWEFRFGVGVSSESWAWLLQSTDLSYRTGGATRLSEWRTRRTWSRNSGDVTD